MARVARERLTRELVIDGSFSQEKAITLVVSAALEIETIYSKFLRCSATDAEMERLSTARMQLTRGLRLLGLPRARAEGRYGQGASALERYLRSREQQQTTATAALEGDPDGQS
jgi:hypothetical protein